MIKEEVKRDFLSNNPLIINSNSKPKYFSIEESRPFKLQLWISERELQQMITIQKQIKAEFDIEKTLVEIEDRSLETALKETVKTCSIGEGV